MPSNTSNLKSTKPNSARTTWRANANILIIAHSLMVRKNSGDSDVFMDVIIYNLNDHHIRGEEGQSLFRIQEEGGECSSHQKLFYLQVLKLNTSFLYPYQA